MCMRKIIGYILLVISGAQFPSISYCQPKTKLIDSNGTAIVAPAGDYQRSFIHNILFGRNYRREWGTPVSVPIAILDTLAGGLIPYKAGGGRQSKSLHLHDKDNREYVLRSIDKSFGRALPSVFRNTFIEDAIDDQVTFDHPYASLSIPMMAHAAGILHTDPQMVYIPEQPGLDTFNQKFGGYTYMLEQRPDENWETADNFGNSKKIISSSKMLKKLLKDNDNKVDQQLYARSRLFDMLIGDWGRHEDQWRWAVFDENGKKIYRAIPRDRDHAYSQFGGLLPTLFIHAANLDYLRSFGCDIKGIKIYGYTARHLDRQCANELTKQEWIDIAANMQKGLTDKVIENAMRALPSEVYALSGTVLTQKLKSRRDHLRDFAERYYSFIAKEVDVPGSEDRELFDVKRLNEKETLVNIYKINKNNSISDSPLYSRIFNLAETKEVRLYGINGTDKFLVSGDVKHAIRVRLIGGNDADTIIDRSEVKGPAKKTIVYDDERNTIIQSSETRLHLNSDSANHAYNYSEFEYPRKGIRPLLAYNNPDKLFASIGYGYAHHAWRKYPYGSRQAIYLRYSITENSWSLQYDATLYQFAGKWNLGLTTNFDAYRSTNFYGLGNETTFPAWNMDYNKLKTKELLGKLNLNRAIGHHYISVAIFAKSIQLIGTPNNYITDHYLAGRPDLLELQNFAGTELGYTYQNVDDIAVPKKGVMFYGGGNYNYNIASGKEFYSCNGIVQLYTPIIGKFSISSRTGLNSVSGQPEFYQFASIGGNQNFRGYKRDRFRGNTALYNSNELRYITNIRSYFMNGQGGLVAFIDDGRVWLNGEDSNVWHYAYGGGFLLAPFNKLTLTVTYGTSADGQFVNIRFNKLINSIL